MNRILDELEVALLTPEELQAYAQGFHKSSRTRSTTWEELEVLDAALIVIGRYCTHPVVNRYAGVDAYCGDCWRIIDDTRRA
jgi:hypothetical protein